MHWFITRSKPTRTSTRNKKQVPVTDVTDDDDDVQEIDEIDMGASKKSKNEVKASLTDKAPISTETPKASKKPKNPKKSAKGSSKKQKVDKPITSNSSASADRERRDSVLASITKMQQELQGLSQKLDKDTDDLDSLIRLQSVASNLISQNAHRQGKKIEQSIGKMRNLYANRKQSQDDRRELIDSAMEIINALYNSYLKMTAKYYSTLWWNNPPSHRSELLLYVYRLIGPVHPHAANGADTW